MNNVVFVAAGIFLAIAAGYFAHSGGYLDVSQETQTEEAESVEDAMEQVSEGGQTAAVEEDEAAEEEPVASVGTPISGKKFTVEEAKAAPRLCETDDDCKIIPITCNECDCGRAVNSWIEPYDCTEEDKSTFCPLQLSCPESKAVCVSGTCEKVEI